MREQLSRFSSVPKDRRHCIPVLFQLSRVYRTADILSEDRGSKSVRGIISLAGYL